MLSWLWICFSAKSGEILMEAVGMDRPRLKFFFVERSTKGKGAD
jgi:hypothetical protein